MPFKTKRQKLAASGRHTISFSDTATVAYKNRSVSDNREAVSTPGPSKKSVKIIDADYRFVKAELSRIILLAAMIIGLQVALKLSKISIF